MIIHGLTVSVGYASWLAQGIARWRAGLASLTVVTAPSDEQTIAVAESHGAHVVVTDLFYADGAAFNKGRAMEHARRQMPWSDWILFFDADVVPPADWHARLGKLAPGALYGCHRFDAQDGRIEDVGQPRCRQDVPGLGYCQLFHSQDPAVANADPLIDTHWRHAGNYDNRFMDRWRTRGRPVRVLPFRVAHVGEHHNWFGRDQRAAYEAMLAERARRGGQLDHERIKDTVPAMLSPGEIVLKEGQQADIGQALQLGMQALDRIR